jgi:uncharacterized protein YunC (DUF1805 family)
MEEFGGERMSFKLLRSAQKVWGLDGRFCGVRLLMVKRELLGLSEVGSFPISYHDADVAVMEDEIIMAMRLLGVKKIDEVTPGMVECLKEVWR